MKIFQIFNGSLVIDHLRDISYTVLMASPGEELIETLDDLRHKLNDLRERLQKSGVERTVGLRDAMGIDCTFYHKSMDLFLKKDYIEIRDMIQSVNKLFNIVEG